MLQRATSGQQVLRAWALCLTIWDLLFCHRGSDNSRKYALSCLSIMCRTFSRAPGRGRMLDASAQYSPILRSEALGEVGTLRRCRRPTAREVWHQSPSSQVAPLGLRALQLPWALSRQRLPRRNAPEWVAACRAHRGQALEKRKFRRRSPHSPHRPLTCSKSQLRPGARNSLLRCLNKRHERPANRPRDVQREMLRAKNAFPYGDAQSKARHL